ncbi:adenosylcobinamide-phosphate synthase CbiB [Desulfolutivibrio sulfoxidireducens]|uniref:adenosylcobinamide-phosphate synthase CbiB n=1 Tax=Desulfolutivibrio sulfoxidireducens TaxID=2773299 RepID=UPI00159D99C0|nr:adenosylcobinamide-phosphate synthase CbiB [Desulfolutivibrio sulfoxidireducens]QLA16704.1 cobalamin biosynthesis protein CobD [Desulfolutivibrio sulfoxidireducens]
MHPAVLIAAALLDRILGDPPGWPHPVRLIGRGLSVLERLAPERPLARRLYGAACTLAMAGACALAVSLLVSPPLLGLAAALYFSYAGLALGCLVREARDVMGFLDAGDLPGARRAVAMLVSRETATMDEAAVRRALAETVSENLCDGFVAPLFYLTLGGPALLWAYKTVSTMDSMWGYRTPRFRELGWFSARADDVLAFVPARISALAIVASGVVLGRPARGLFGRIRIDAARSASPNAGWPMAAAAWVCGAGMGGSAIYFGQVVEKPRMGPDGKWDARVLHLLLRIVSLSGTLLISVAAFMLAVA